MKAIFNGQWGMQLEPILADNVIYGVHVLYSKRQCSEAGTEVAKWKQAYGLSVW